MEIGATIFPPEGGTTNDVQLLHGIQ